MEKTIKQKVILLLCAVMAACMAIGCAAAFSHKANAQEVTEKYISFNEPDYSVISTTNSNSSYVLFDSDNNSKVSTSEAYIYGNGRFVPGATYDATLLWTAPQSGLLTVQSGTIKLSLSSEKYSKNDGIKWALLKISADGKAEKLTDSFWNDLVLDDACLSGTTYEKEVSYANVSNLQMEKGEKIAIVINRNTNNTWDQPYITASIELSSTDKEASTYEFNTSNIVDHANALNNSTEYAVGTETTNYYSWGASTFTEKQTLTADVETSTFTQTNVMDGKVESNLVYKGQDEKNNETGQWNIDGGTGNYHVAINGSVAKICAMGEFNDTQLVWKAPEDGVFSLDSLSLVMKDTSSKNPDATSDGMKFAILYKNSEGKYFDLYTEDEIAGDAPWHNLVWKADATTINDLSDFAMQKDDEFIVMFNRKNSNTLDPCEFDITISFAADGGEKTEYAIVQKSAVFTTQGINNFYFRTVSYTQSIIYRQNSVKIKFDAYSDGYCLSDGEVVTLGENEQFVGWRLNNALYKAGSTYTYASDKAYVEFTPVIITLKTEENAGLRISSEQNDAGIRFVSNYDLSSLKNGEYSFGSIIAPVDKITDEEAFVKGGTLAVKDIPAVNYKTNDGMFTQNAVINNIPEEQYARELKSRGYVTVTYQDNSTETFYTNLSGARSVAYVAYNSYDVLSELFNFEENEDLKNVVEKFKNAYAVSSTETEEN